MIQKILDNKLLLIIIHITFGFLGTFPLFPKIYGLLIILLPIYLISFSNNKKEEAFLFASYIVGAEVFGRMIGGFYLYEMGKYAVILYLVIGIFVGRFKQVFSVHYIFYILLLLFGIIYTQVPVGESLRTNIVFNLSGPIVLGVVSFYFYLRPISKQQLMDALFFMILPLFSMITYLYFRTPDVSEIVFGGVANFTTSGGFGPNQVATAIGLGMIILTIFILQKEKLTGFIFLDSLFLIYFTYRGLLTFSRGGILTAAICIFFFAFFYIVFKRISIGVFFKYISIAIFFMFAIWLYTSNITNGMLDNRYVGQNAIGVQKDITSGRLDILQIQFDNFLNNPLGIGVGNGKYLRLESLKEVTGASHNEIGRLLEEHGYIGLVILIMLISIPLFNFLNSNYYQKAFIICFYLLWLLTISHSAMRIALPGFIYGLSLIRITDNEED
ncbi:O-antigen ligase family protein [Polaribacter sp. MSW13]|uniref:O-antigen ligase family protein n=1 Tax=Polaribacter marinus TaxID=2916838 RepID=A0A9X1VPR2_9FLAO|nr:O-antigen ligase family protein [Polaribacter marinus]MCI2228400.1 O-antigen ligase family protein [Polaribacter marinus]